MPDWLEVIVRTVIAISILFIMTKMLGKRQLSQLSLFEYITGISIGNIAAYVSLDLDKYWYMGLISITVWVLISVGIEWATLKSRSIRNFVDGKGTVLLQDGKLLLKNLTKEKLTIDELLSQMRSRDIFAIDQIEYAVMESNGSINFMLKKEYQPLTADTFNWKMAKEQAPKTIIMDGIIIDESLITAGFDKQWLMNQLQQYKVPLEEVLIGQILSDNQLIIQTRDGVNYPSDQPNKATQKIADLTESYEAELKRLGQYARNDSDRKVYERALQQFKENKQ
ncbi:DUF421 domain-containing protein [Paenibacillus yanchengensis]|uniref:DUF421 domain-containing protein n=1 Tax=Paenibacillus yanchengensis TaxID=2035833 RepID=A0ABW4YJU8_9BACL